MEPRAAVAEWNDGKLTVWTGCDGPFRAPGELAEAFKLDPGHVRVIVPDMGGGFGGKHSRRSGGRSGATGESRRTARLAAVDAAEEFTWAYFRPAAVIDCKAGIERGGTLVAWDFVNINGGGAASPRPTESRTPGTLPLLPTPRCDRAPIAVWRRRATTSRGSRSWMSWRRGGSGSPGLPPGSPRESPAAGCPRDCRPALQLGRAQKESHGRNRRGTGMRNGKELLRRSLRRGGGRPEAERNPESVKCARSSSADRSSNPANLLSQVQGCIIMGLGGALTEEIEFENGKIQNASFTKYQVPRFADVPKLDIHLLDNRDIPPPEAERRRSSLSHRPSEMRCSRRPDCACARCR